DSGSEQDVEWFYLHGGGAIGPSSAAQHVWAASSQVIPDLPTGIPDTGVGGENAEAEDAENAACTGGKPTRSILVQLSDNMDGFALPEPPKGQELRDAVRASLQLLELGPARVSFPLFAAIWRAALG